MGLTICKATSHKRTGSWSVARIKRVNVKGDRIAATGSGGDLNRFVNAGAHAAFVDFAHSYKTNSQLAHQLSLIAIDIARTYVHAQCRIKFGRKAGDVGKLRGAKTQQNCQRHPMN